MVVDPKSPMATIVNAGHMPPIVNTAADGSINLISSPTTTGLLSKIQVSKSSEDSVLLLARHSARTAVT